MARKKVLISKKIENIPSNFLSNTHSVGNTIEAMAAFSLRGPTRATGNQESKSCFAKNAVVARSYLETEKSVSVCVQEKIMKQNYKQEENTQSLSSFL